MSYKKDAVVVPEDVIQFIEDAELNSLCYLNNKIVKRINSLQSERLAEAAKQFSIGDKVWFKEKQFPFTRHEMIITTINRKTISGHEENIPRVTWRCSPTILNKC